MSMKNNRISLLLAVILFVLLVFLVYKGCHNADSWASNSELQSYQQRGNDYGGINSKQSDDPLAERPADLTDAPSEMVVDSVGNPVIGDGIQIDSLLLALLPANIDDRPEQILVRTSYIVSYNKEWRIPNWVAWHLTADHVDGDAPRRNSFREDPDVPEPRANPSDYKGSGWSRGHMCPSGDNKWNPRANHDTFLLTNLCPQDANLNSGLWNSIEMDCRKWARKYGDVFIVCGPLPLRPPFETIGENRVAVPKAFFKIVLCLNKSPKAFGFVVKNRSGEKKTNLYYNTVREVERLTNIDFFPLLPDSIEDQVENHADISEW